MLTHLTGKVVKLAELREDDGKDMVYIEFTDGTVFEIFSHLENTLESFLMLPPVFVDKDDREGKS